MFKIVTYKDKKQKFKYIYYTIFSKLIILKLNF